MGNLFEEVKHAGKEIDPNIKASLSINGKVYELLSFTTEFLQEVTHKGEPLHIKKGGLLSFTLNQPTEHFFNNWMLSRDMKPYSGKIVFRNPDAHASPVLTISFENAVCISYQKEISGEEKGVLLRLIISPQEITFGNVNFDNGPWAD